MADPLTALMYAVQVMNFLRTLIIKTLREREDSITEPASTSSLEPFDKNGHQSPSQPTWLEDNAQEDNEESEQTFAMEEPVLESPPYHTQDKYVKDRERQGFLTSLEKSPNMDGSCETLTHVEKSVTETEACYQVNNLKSKSAQSSNSNIKKGQKVIDRQLSSLCDPGPLEKTKGISNLSRINSRTERIEAWR